MIPALSIRRWARTARAVARKDLRTEARRGTVLTVWVTLGLVCTAIASFDDDGFDLSSGRMKPAVAWFVLALTGSIAMGRGFRDEHRLGGWQGMLTTTAPPGAIYLGKLLSNLILMLIAVLTAIIAYSLTAGWPSEVLTVTGIAALGTLGITAAGTLNAAVGTRNRRGSIRIAVVGLLLTLPVVALAAEATREALNTSRTSSWPVILSLLVGYVVVFIVAATATFGLITSND